MTVSCSHLPMAYQFGEGSSAVGKVMTGITATIFQTLFCQTLQEEHRVILWHAACTIEQTMGQNQTLVRAGTTWGASDVRYPRTQNSKWATALMMFLTRRPIQASQNRNALAMLPPKSCCCPCSPRTIFIPLNAHLSSPCISHDAAFWDCQCLTCCWRQSSHSTG